ncbi:MAG TPA: cytochrome c peroxidase [Polyangiaceae bacterium]|jgi:cytochrome c peroxidase|nr:cytochrome c peroxidase [Polyangiaceae bacterium]
MAARERSRVALGLAVAVGLGAGACGQGGNGSGVDGEGAPALSAGDRAALQSLRYDDGPEPADPSNLFADDPAAQRFGQRLFYEKAFSGALLEGDNDGTSVTLGQRGESGRVSCAGCHVPTTGFVDTRSPHRQVSLAAQWTLRKTPTLLEVGFAPLYNWDGRRDAIWNQALGVMESNREFNSARLFVAEQLFRLYRDPYETVFEAMPPFDDAGRFPQLSGDTAGCVEVSTPQGSTFRCRGVPGDGADYDGMAPGDQKLVTVAAVNATKALDAYVRRLRCGPGRFDAWLDGDANALSASERRGAALFVGSAGCATCHSGPRLTDGQFHNVGLSPAVVAVAILDDDDHGAATGVAAALEDPMSTAGEFSDGDREALPPSAGPELEGAFRTPTLRCSASHPSFMHTGQLKDLAQVVAFFNRGGDPAGHYPGNNELTPLGLGSREQADLVAFLGTLVGPGPDPSLIGAPE